MIKLEEIGAESEARTFVLGLLLVTDDLNSDPRDVARVFTSCNYPMRIGMNKFVAGIVGDDASILAFCLIPAPDCLAQETCSFVVIS